ncbi:MAG: MBOAT family protein [Acidobacteriota bacterium]
MVFSSHLFIFYFLPVALALYYVLPRRLRHLQLTLVSYVFYGWANPIFMVLMAVSTLIDYVAGLAQVGRLNRKFFEPIELLPFGGPRSRAQKTALILSICSNIGLLAFFKYFNFGIDSYNALMQAVGLGHLQWETFFRVTLPLGISFYTFQSLSYSIDVYRGEALAIRNPIDFACYVSMFPQLVAGPIIRFHEVAQQLRERTLTMEKFARGVAFFSFGLGFVFAKNFDSPYKSQSITEFWLRWHLSLSTWLRDNLYIALGGNRKGPVRTYANLAMVMLLGGLWHGAAWNFVVWGAIHGGFLVIERLRGKQGFYSRMPAGLRVAFTFLIASLSWVFFRSPDLPVSVEYLASMLGVGAVQDGTGLISGLIYQPYFLAMMAIAAVLVWAAPQTWDFTRELTWSKAALSVVVLLLSVATMATQAFNPCIYFIF